MEAQGNAVSRGPEVGVGCSIEGGVHGINVGLRDSRMLIAALLVLLASKTQPELLPSVLLSSAFMDSYREDVFTTTRVFFFLSRGKKCLVVRKGPTTLVMRTCMYSWQVLQAIVAQIRRGCQLCK